MEQSSSVEQLNKLLVGLYVQPGVTGACLQLGGTMLIHDLPYSDTRVTNLAERIDTLVASYESVGRTIWQICAGFENFRLLVLVHSTMRLTLMIHPDMDPGLAGARGMHLLMEAKNHAPPPVPIVKEAPSDGSHIERQEFEKLVAGLMGRVTGSAQAARLIQRELATQKLNGSTMLPKEEARRIGITILDYIPNRGKRAALSSEFLNALEQ
ncbi:hypothetical protein BH09VER1_BH09VER1_31500 [soil metagenome]